MKILMVQKLLIYGSGSRLKQGKQSSVKIHLKHVKSWQMHNGVPSFSKYWPMGNLTQFLKL